MRMRHRFERVRGCVVRAGVQCSAVQSKDQSRHVVRRARSHSSITGNRKTASKSALPYRPSCMLLTTHYHCHHRARVELAAARAKGYEGGRERERETTKTTRSTIELNEGPISQGHHAGTSLTPESRGPSPVARRPSALFPLSDSHYYLAPRASRDHMKRVNSAPTASGPYPAYSAGHIEHLISPADLSMSL